MIIEFRRARRRRRWSDDGRSSSLARSHRPARRRPPNDPAWWIVLRPTALVAGVVDAFNLQRELAHVVGERTRAALDSKCVRVTVTVAPQQLAGSDLPPCRVWQYPGFTCTASVSRRHLQATQRHPPFHSSTHRGAVPAGLRELTATRLLPRCHSSQLTAQTGGVQWLSLPGADRGAGMIALSPLLLCSHPFYPAHAMRCGIAGMLVTFRHLAVTLNSTCGRADLYIDCLLVSRLCRSFLISSYLHTHSESILTSQLCLVNFLDELSAVAAHISSQPYLRPLCASPSEA